MKVIRVGGDPPSAEKRVGGEEGVRIGQTKSILLQFIDSLVQKTFFVA